MEWTLITNCGDRPACRLDFAYCKIRLPIKSEEDSESKTNEIKSARTFADVLFINGGMDTEGNVFDDSFLIRLD